MSSPETIRSNEPITLQELLVIARKKLEVEREKAERQLTDDRERRIEEIQKIAAKFLSDEKLKTLEDRTLEAHLRSTHKRLLNELAKLLQQPSDNPLPEIADEDVFDSLRDHTSLISFLSIAIRNRFDGSSEYQEIQFPVVLNLTPTRMIHLPPIDHEIWESFRTRLEAQLQRSCRLSQDGEVFTISIGGELQTF